MINFIKKRLQSFRIRIEQQYTEIVRVVVPDTLSLEKRKTLIKSVINLQKGLVDADTPLILEVFYRDTTPHNLSHWSIPIKTVDAMSIKGDCLWVLDSAIGSEIPFNLHFVVEVYCSTKK